MSVSTTSAERGPSLRTFTGRTIWPSDPRPEELHAVDLAHHLSLICRFCGFIPTKHAVGQHCLHTESFITVDIWRGPTLIHEVGEAFSGFGDVAGPIKKIPEVAALIKKREGWIETAASERFGVPIGFASHPIVKAADKLAEARKILGPDKRLCVEQMVVLETDPARAREAARKTLAFYFTLPNYLNNWLRMGFTEADFANGGSDSLIDDTVAWGDEAAIVRRIEQHWEAGADHVCIQPLSSTPDGKAASPSGYDEKLLASLARLNR